MDQTVAKSSNEVGNNFTNIDVRNVVPESMRLTFRFIVTKSSRELLQQNFYYAYLHLSDEIHLEISLPV